MKKIAGTIKPRRRVTKQHAKILRDYAAKIERGEIKNLVMSIDDIAGVEHTFVGDSYTEISGMAQRLVYRINKERDES